ncbi:hypothetical protein [Pseudomonas sp. MWU13-2100]|uniref:hypothetical protein n=1 Tax=Pseudomonas sp. MWU13-2100 TaxID=2935075 RepID=UPI00200E3128|nr:hypothetical protein [Pseudomonas sp. MWU13-2100]
MMDHQDSLSAFLARYFPTFICAFFLACFSLGGAISLVSSSYFRGDPERARYAFLAALVLGLFLAFSHFAMIRGRKWGISIIVGFYLLGFLAVLSTFGYRPHLGAYVSALLFPLLGLLLVNSKRHREMRGVLVTIRQQREELHRLHKRRGKRR